MPDELPAPTKLCFVVGPIGSDGGPERDNADLLVDFVIKPVLEPLGYVVERADRITTPGMISDQVINKVISADLVIADLTGHNPNAFYELALRHAHGAPHIHMITDGGTIPFDVFDYRTIKYSLRGSAGIFKAREELEAQAREVDAAGYQVMNPITRAREVGRLSASSDDKDRMLADLLTTVRDLESRMQSAERVAREKSAPLRSLFPGVFVSNEAADPNIVLTLRKSALAQKMVEEQRAAADGRSTDASAPPDEPPSKG
jgi:hypothetical protein